MSPTTSWFSTNRSLGTGRLAGGSTGACTAGRFLLALCVPGSNHHGDTGCAAAAHACSPCAARSTWPGDTPGFKP
jgi:hypothetical protein